jgi:copper chaperone CopZ
MSDLALKISGMSCAHCAQAVTRALAAVPGVASAQVDLAAMQARVSGTADPARLIAAVQAAGYGAEAADG